MLQSPPLRQCGLRNAFLILASFLLVGLAALPAGAAEPPLFESDFESGDAAEWSLVQPPLVVTITVDPPSPKIDITQVQELTATVLNTRERGVTWTVSPGAELIGQGATILFVPDSTGLFTVTATSVQNPALSATATITVVHPPRIEFVSDRSVTLGGPGEQASLEIRVIGENGQPIPGAQVTWASQDPTLVSVSPDSATSATVTAVSSGVGSTRIVVSHAGLGLSAEAPVALARTAASTVPLQSSWLQARNGNSLTLERNPTTETLAVDQVIVSGDQAGILDRVTATTLGSSTVQVTVEPASLTDAYETLQVDTESETLRLRFDWLESGEGVISMVTPDGRLLSRKALSGFQCKTELGAPAAVTLQGSHVGLDYSLRTRASLDLGFFSVDSFLLEVIGEMSFGASTGSIRYQSELSGKITCSQTLGTFDLPGVPVSVFTIAPRFTAKVGIETELSASGPSFEIAGPKGGVQATATAGIQFVAGSGWSTPNSFSWGPYFELFPGGIELDSEFDLTAGPFGSLEAAVLFQLGRGPFSVDLAEVKFAELKGSSPLLTASLGTPFDPEDPAYAGPDWGIDANLQANLESSLSGGALETVLDRIGISLSFAEPLQLFSANERLIGSPSAGSATYDSHPSCTGVPKTLLAAGDEVELAVATDGNEAGVAEIWGQRQGTPAMVELASGNVAANGNGSVTWTVEPGQTPGPYELRNRLRLDDLSRDLPYTTGDDYSVEVVEGSGAPEIGAVSTPGTMTGDETPYPGSIDFVDSTAGVELFVAEVLSDTCGGCATGGTFDPGVYAATSGQVGFVQTCRNTSGSPFSVTHRLRLLDCQGNDVVAVEYTTTCQPVPYRGDEPPRRESFFDL